MPNDTYVRQDSTLERYDDAKPILDAEYLAAEYPKTYRYDLKLMPITKWLVMISIKYMIWPPPPPPPTPYWPCNMVLTEHRQTQCENPHSPRHHSNGGKQKKLAARKLQRRRHNVSGTHVESPEHLPKEDGPSLQSSHLIGHHTRSKSLSPPPGLLHTSKHHQVQGLQRNEFDVPTF